jgi:hypothetical protein
MKSRKGYTLAELMVAMTIAIMVIGAVASVFMTIDRSVHGLSESIDLNARTRVIQERIAFDVRNITELTSVTPQSFSGKLFNYATGTEETIVYTLTGGKLTRSINGGAATTVLKDLVTTTSTTSAYSEFRFSDRIGVTTTTETADKSKVTAIRFDLVPQATTRQKLGLTRTVNDPFCSALFQLRNCQGSSS